MDLSKLKTHKADEGAPCQIVHPATEEPIAGMTLTLLGTDSEVYTKIRRQREQAVMNRAMKGRNAQKIDAEKVAQDTVDDLVKLTVGWEGFELEGKPLKCTPENARMVYTDWAWIKEQAQAFIQDRANFF